MNAPEYKELIQILKARFEGNPSRHTGVDWSNVQAKLEADQGNLGSLQEMDRTGGEPDVVAFAGIAGSYAFVDCSSESPPGRRSLCYDPEALESRKKNKPVGSAVGLASSMGIELLTEEQYLALQQLGQFDNKTSSWVRTPTEIRNRGGALFCDRRYGSVFLYHNGAESYYAARGFRGILQI
jgi:hypothetical protein